MRGRLPVDELGGNGLRVQESGQNQNRKQFKRYNAAGGGRMGRVSPPTSCDLPPTICHLEPALSLPESRILNPVFSTTFPHFASNFLCFQ